MRCWQNALITTAAVVGFISVASAADLPVRTPIYPVYGSRYVVPVYNWTGGYFGGNIGYGWNNSISQTLQSFTDPGGAVGFAGYAAAGGFSPPSVSPVGVLGGIQLGYNYQFSPYFVAGAVVDLQATNISASGTNVVPPVVGFPITTTQTTSAKITWFDTVRGKAGIAQNNWLFYGTGGLAYAGIKATTTQTCTAGCAIPASFYGSAQSSRAGWTAGAGIEYAFARNWSVGVEYLYYDLGKLSVTATDQIGTFPGATFTMGTTRFAGSIARGTINYRFD